MATKSFKEVIVYLLFIIGIIIVSDWVLTKVRQINTKSSYDRKIEEILEQVKEEIKKEYLLKTQKYISLMNSKESFSNVTQEDIVMKQAEEKLKSGLVSYRERTIGDTTRDVDSTNIEGCPEYYMDLSKKFKRVDRTPYWTEKDIKDIQPFDTYTSSFYSGYL